MAASAFKYLADIEYFQFEEDFIEKNVRCIPMIVRFKMDAAGIKLKLAEWSRFSVAERINLAKMPCGSEQEAKLYHHYLAALIRQRTGNEATVLAIDKHPAWADVHVVPELLAAKLQQCGWHLSGDQWKKLTDLQRFALLKLCKEGHENKNFPKAMKEFGLAG